MFLERAPEARPFVASRIEDDDAVAFPLDLMQLPDVVFRGVRRVEFEDVEVEASRVVVVVVELGVDVRLAVLSVDDAGAAVALQFAHLGQGLDQAG